MKLTIIVPHYKESWDVCHNLFDSIEVQQGINKADIDCVVVEDGGDPIEIEYLASYHYPIAQISNGHGGVSRARNAGLDWADGDYVMFCDCDDMFHNAFGLRLLFSAMQEEPCVIHSTFVEEQIFNGYRLNNHSADDVTFVHGKAYKRAFLIDKNIRFKDELTIHEDGYFVFLAYVCADGSFKKINTPFYLWKWNENSVVRNDLGSFVLHTYPHLIRAREAIVSELYERGYTEQANLGVAKTFWDTFYDMQKPDSVKAENAKYVKDAEKSFKRFYQKWKNKFYGMSLADNARVSADCRNMAYANGFTIEATTMRNWLNHIKIDV